MTPGAITDIEAAELLSPLSGTRALIAFSGGPDSTALLGLAAGLRERLAVTLLAATVDHGLRPESTAEAQVSASFCKSLGVPHCVLSWEGPKPLRGIQEAARDARYSLLRAAAQEFGATLIVTAHTLEDQAETILMRMAAGTGIGGLAGMRAESRHRGITLCRPLLGISKHRLVATCEQRGWPASADPSNSDVRFARVRMRKLLPMLAAEGLTAERLSVLARRASEADAALAGQAEERLHAATLAGQQIDARLLLARPVEIARRALGLAILRQAQGESMAAMRLQRLEALHAELTIAVGCAKPLRRSLMGLVLSLDRKGVLDIRGEAPRKRGR